MYIPPSAFGLTGSRCLWKRIWMVSIISLVVSTGLLDVLSSPISFGLIISTALSAFFKKGKAFCKSLSAYSFCAIIVFFWATQFSATMFTSSAFSLAFLFSISTSLRSLSVFSVASFNLTSSALRSILRTSTPSEASLSLSRPLTMFLSSISIPSYLVL